MATTISTQDIVDAKRDIDDIGKAVNEKVIVSPRYGEDFKSLPMITTELQVAVEAAAAAGAGANGWTDLLVLTQDGSTQRAKNASLQSQINQKASAAYLDSALSQQTQTVNTALSQLSTAANKFYPTLADANADIANIEVNQPIQVGESGGNGGLWYRGTAGATSLTKSPYDPLTQAKAYVSNTGEASVVGSALSNIDYVTATRTLEFKNTLFVVSGTSRYQLTTPQSVALPSNAPYRIEYNVSTGLISAVAYQQVRTEGSLVVGFSTASATTLQTLDFGFTVDGAATDATTKANAAEANAKNYANDNNMFQPKGLVENQDLDNLQYGRYYVPNRTVGASILNKPDSLPGTSFSIDAFPATNGIRSQTLTYYTESNSQLFIYDRVYDAGKPAWWPWRKRLTESDLPDLQDYVKNNLFKQLDFSSVGASSFQATVLQEEGANVLSMNTDGLRVVYYDYAVSDLMRTGDVLSFSVDIKTDVTGLTGADISLEFLNANKTRVGTTAVFPATKANEWHRLSVSATVPLDAAYVRVRFIRRPGASTYVKFRYPILLSSSWYARNASGDSSASNGSSGGANSLFVAKTGSDTNDGSQAEPFLTINRAISALNSTGGTITILDNDWYREAVTSNSPHKIVIQSARGKRAKIVGSDRLVVTKSNGYSKVYQAPLAAKPTGKAQGMGQPMIAEWGTKYREIEARDIHALQRGYTHYLPYTPMYEAASLAELDTLQGNGKWWWESGIIYFSATDGSDATLKQYEARMRDSFTRTVGATECYRLDFLFSKLHGYISWGTHTYRQDCAAYGCGQNGFSDWANSTVAYRDIALGNGNDGLNGSVSQYAGTENLETACQATYFDPWCALQGDDGCSFHVRGTCNIYGGMMEYNTKAGVVHVTGGGGNCFNTIARGQDYGFYTATEAPDGRIFSSISCHSTISERNHINHQASGSTELHCHNTISIDPVIWGYSGTIYTYDAKFIGDAAKAKNGNVVVKNSTTLT